MKDALFATGVLPNDGGSAFNADDLDVVVRVAPEEGAPMDDEQMDTLRAELAVQDWLDPLMTLMRAAGNDTRMRILYLLWRRGEVRVNDLATILELTTPAISQQLKKLRECGLVQTRRDAQTIYYRLNTASEFVRSLAQFFAQHSSPVPIGS